MEIYLWIQFYYYLAFFTVIKLEFPAFGKFTCYLLPATCYLYLLPAFRTSRPKRQHFTRRSIIFCRLSPSCSNSSFDSFGMMSGVIFSRSKVYIRSERSKSLNSFFIASSAILNWIMFRHVELLFELNHVMHCSPFSPTYKVGFFTYKDVLPIRIFAPHKKLIAHRIMFLHIV